MEWKTDTAEVREKWPYVLEAITTHSYTMPILLVADTEGEPPFPLFKSVRGDLRYLDPKKPFAQESYTSAYLMRLQGEGRCNVPDAAILREQELVYEALLYELLAFFREQLGEVVNNGTEPGSGLFHRFGEEAR